MPVFQHDTLSEKISQRGLLHAVHDSGAGMEADMEKYNAAAIAGWRVLRFTRGIIETGMAGQEIKKVLLGQP